jgi:hypothetical protein
VNKIIEVGKSLAPSIQDAISKPTVDNIAKVGSGIIDKIIPAQHQDIAKKLLDFGQ